MIISERDLFVEPKYGAKKQGPEFKQDKNTEIMFAYRESLASLPKMDDLASDLQTCEATKIQDLPMLEEKPVVW